MGRVSKRKTTSRRLARANHAIYLNNRPSLTNNESTDLTGTDVLGGLANLQLDSSPRSNPAGSNVKFVASRRKLDYDLDFVLSPSTPNRSKCDSGPHRPWITPEMTVKRRTPLRLRTYSRKQHTPLRPHSPIKDWTKTHTQEIQGRRLISITSITNGLNLAAKHGQICGNADLYIHKENKFGMKSSFVIACRNCKHQFFTLTDEGNQTVPVNEAAAWAGNATGIGFTALKHSFTTLDVPFMNFATYQKNEDIFQKKLDIAFTKMIEENGQEEKALAEQLGQIDGDNMVYTDCIGDCQWSRRSYNEAGSALSGSGNLIGALTRKVLFAGVRNKFCIICHKTPEKEHTCYKNWDGTSSGMEPDIILQGFKESISTHGLRYKRYVGDGDSSVFAAIKDVYHKDNYFINVQKIECVNHAFRRTKKNLRNLSKNTALSPPYPRECLAKKVDLIIKCCRYATQHHIENRPETNSDTLTMDIAAIRFHVFGNHTKCSTLFCKDGKLQVPVRWKKDKLDKKIEATPNATKDGTTEYDYLSAAKQLWTEIGIIMDRLKSHSISLMYGLNIAESFQSQVNKFAQGRRVNNIQRGGYNKILKQAAMAFQLGPTYYVTAFSMSTGSPPSKLWIQRMDREAARKLSLQAKVANGTMKKYKFRRITAQANRPDYFSHSRPKLGDADYGDHSKSIDQPEEEISARIDYLLQEIAVVDIEEQWNTHLKTTGQFSNKDFKERRRNMVTASIAGRICKTKDSTSNVNILDDLLAPKNMDGVKAIQWGKDHERNAKELYEAQQLTSVQDSGIFVSLEFGGLGASPDGLVGDDGILEIKCPFVGRFSHPLELILLRKYPLQQKYDPKTKEPTHLQLTKSHDYYYQVIMQLHVTGRKWCDFVVWTQGELNPSTNTPVTPMGHIIIKRIFKDSDTLMTWNKMKEKLVRFYMQDYAPEIVDSRYTRNMGYRQPPYRLTAIEKDAEAKKSRYLIKIKAADEKKTTAKSKLSTRKSNNQENESTLKTLAIPASTQQTRYGFLNLRNNCYRNATFQMLLEMPEVYGALKTNPDNIIMRHLALTEAPSDKFTLTTLMLELDQFLPDFANNAQQDACEFMLKVLQICEASIPPLFSITTLQSSSCSCGYILSDLEAEEQNLFVPIISSSMQENVNSTLSENPITDHICPQCSKSGRVTSITRILQPPQYLLLQLIRYDSKNRKIHRYTDHPFQLEIEVGGASINYHLKGIVNHIGRSATSGHYIYASTDDGIKFNIYDDIHTTKSINIRGSSYLYLYHHAQ